MYDKYSKKKKLAQLRRHLQQREGRLKRVQEVRQSRAVIKRYFWWLPVSALIAALIVAVLYL
jgi:hypothetical protein